MSNKTIWDLAVQNANSMERANSNNNVGKESSLLVLGSRQVRRKPIYIIAHVRKHIKPFRENYGTEFYRNWSIFHLS